MSSLYALRAFARGEGVKRFAGTGKQVANAVHIQDAAGFMGGVLPAGVFADHAVAYAFARIFLVWR